MSDIHTDDPGAGEGYDESPELDLSPRSPVGGAVAPRTGRRRPVGAYVALAAVVLGIGVVVLQGLGNATLYFRNVDEAVAEREELGDRRFRLQGLVVDDVASDGDRVTFSLTFNGETVAVRHAGDPPDLFRPDQSVVLEGRFEGDVFLSDRMLVKHDEDYTEDNSERIVDAEDGETG